MIIVCDKCGDVLSDFGGLLFSPPKNAWQVEKYHLCVTCWRKMIGWLENA